MIVDQEFPEITGLGAVLLPDTDDIHRPRDHLAPGEPEVENPRCFHGRGQRDHLIAGDCPTRAITSSEL